MLAQLIQFPADRARKPGAWAPRNVPADMILLPIVRQADNDLAFWLAWWCDSWRVACGLRPIFHDIYAGGEKPCDS